MNPGPNKMSYTKKHPYYGWPRGANVQFCQDYEILPALKESTPEAYPKLHTLNNSYGGLCDVICNYVHQLVSPE